MVDHRDTSAEVDTSRQLNRARAALREAAEYLEDAVAAREHPSLGVASALSHVNAARKAIRPYGLGEDGDASAVEAA